MMAAFLLVGCNKSETGTDANTTTTTGGGSTGAGSTGSTAVDLPADKWQEVKLADFSMKLPKHWQPMDLTADNFDQMMKDVGKNNPNLASMESTLRQYKESGLFKLFAFDMENAKGGFADNMNVIIQKAPSTPNFDDLMKMNQEQLATLATPGSKPETTTLDLPGGKFGRIAYTMNQKSMDGKDLKLKAWAFVHVSGNNIATITFAALDERGDTMEKAANDAMTSFKMN